MTENERLTLKSVNGDVWLLDSEGKPYLLSVDGDDYNNALNRLADFEAIGTIDEFKALKEKFENAKDDIRKLLSSEYGSSCQFCVHDENEDAMCCNIGGSGSWCCENARWKEH